MSKLAKALTAAAGNAGGTLGYVEDVFSTYLYTGNGSTQTITNGIDLDGEGGLVWIKGRDLARNNNLYDTDRIGTYPKHLVSESTAAEIDVLRLSSFNSDGFSLASSTAVNSSGENYASWSFRKAEKFFDVVTYTGNGTTQAISHNLGVAPAFIIVKETSTTRDWVCYHSALGETYRIFLNATSAAINSSSANAWGNNTTAVAPTDSAFTVGNFSVVNESGGSYVAYLFASDAGGFGDDGSESIIKCGSFTASGGLEVDLGFEPQWVLFKRTDSSTGGSWHLYDTMRGFGADGVDHALLYADLANAESLASRRLILTATGFTVTTNLYAGSPYIYIAIRRPMKTPESGTEVFNVKTFTGTDATAVTNAAAGFPVDFAFEKQNYTSANNDYVTSRLTAGKSLAFSNNAAENSENQIWDSMTGVSLSDQGNSYPRVYWMFKRATGFFDVVAYTGDGGTGTINHNLGVAPEMIIVKARQATTADEWYVYHAGTWGDDGSDIFRIATQGAEYTNGYFASTAPTAEYFKVGSSLHASGIGFVSYLFASLDGVSKVGTFTPSASVDTDVDCGFSSGARFVLIKSSVSGNWYIWDSERGIVAGNDPYLLLNSTAAEVTIRDWIDPLSSGFTITSAYANSTGSANKHIFLAIA